MNKNILWLLGILVSLSAGFTSCSEDTQTADPYSDWAVRNDAISTLSPPFARILLPENIGKKY